MPVINLVPGTFNLENGGTRLADNGSPVSISDTLTLLNNYILTPSPLPFCEHSSMEGRRLYIFSKIQLVVYYQCCVLIGGATARLYVIAHL